jgi:hypothetical protein
MTTPGPIQAFKGFDKNMKCRAFQYKEGETYEQAAAARLCSTGFHAVLLPLDALTYYEPGESLYHAVELFDVSDERESDSKIAGRKITIGASLGIPGLVKAHVEAVWAKATEGNDKPTNGTKATSGDGSHSATSGKYSHSATSGYDSHSATSGDRSHSATSGDRSHSATSGKYSNSATSGYDSQAEVKDEGSIAAVVGSGSAAGAKGCWLVLTERDDNLNILGVQAVQVDGKKVKAGVFYTLRGGKVVAA